MESRYRHLLPSLIIGTQIFSVSVSISSLRLIFFSFGLGIEVRHLQSRSCHWDSDLFSLSLVIETHIFSVSVSFLSSKLRHFQPRSQSQFNDQNLVILISNHYHPPTHHRNILKDPRHIWRLLFYMCYPLRLKLEVNSNPQGSNKKFQADHFRTKSCLSRFRLQNNVIQKL